LKYLNLTHFNFDIGYHCSEMFCGCDKLNKNNITTNDSSNLKKFFKYYKKFRDAEEEECNII